MPPHTPVVLLAAIVGSGVAVFVWVFRNTRGAKPLAAFVVSASLLALAQGMALAAPVLATKLFWSNVAASVTALLPLAWLLTVLAYTDSERLVGRRRLALLLVEPAVFAALVWTNADHGLVWTDRWIAIAGDTSYLAPEYGLAMWAHVGYAYLLVAVGGLELVRLNFRTTEFFRSQGTALLGAIFVPAGLGALNVFGTLPGQYELTGIGFVFCGLVMTVVLFRGRLLSITPATRQLGREAVIDEMDDRIVILDDDDRIVDVNPAAATLFDVDPTTVVGTPIRTAAPNLSDAIESVSAGQAELELDGADGRHYYDVRVSPLYRSYGGTAGRVVSFRDVTARRQHEQRLDVLNRVLRHNLRNELNVVRGNAELLRRDVDLSEGDTRRRLDRIEDTVDTVAERSEKIGRISRIVDGEPDREFDVETRLESLATSIESTYPGATVRVDLPDSLTVVGGPSLERAFEELLENAVEHAGDDPSVRVSASPSEGDLVEIWVTDDGPGIERQERVVIEEERETALEHGSGVGLWLVNWVVRECGGSVTFDDGGDGCTVVVTLPTPEAGVTDTSHAAEDDDTADGSNDDDTTDGSNDDDTADASEDDDTADVSTEIEADD